MRLSITDNLRKSFSGEATCVFSDNRENDLLVSMFEIWISECILDDGIIITSLSVCFPI
jgi:hypothetical protein